MVNATICPEDKTNADPAGKEHINAEEPEIKGRPCGKDMTQGALAEAAGVSRQTINAIEKGSTTPPSTFAAVSVKFWIRHWMNCSGRNEL